GCHFLYQQTSVKKRSYSSIWIYLHVKHNWQPNVINLRNAFESLPLKKGDLGGFSNGDKKSPLAPLFLKGGILALS
ncbi:MAG: hypothetical protein PVG46_10385, partial [Desulfobacterales bacterium]